MATDDRLFGYEIAADVVGSLGGGNRVGFIKGFKEGKTRIRIIPVVRKDAEGNEQRDSQAWVTQRMHFDMSLEKGKSFPCVGRWSKKGELLDDRGCVGCENLEDTPGRKWFFSALDEEDRTDVYSISEGLWSLLVTEDKENGTLSDRDYYINRVGTGKTNTKYYPIPHDKYPVDFRDFPALDVNPLLDRTYYDAESSYEERGTKKRRSSEPAPSRMAGRIAKQEAASEHPAKPSDAQATDTEPAPDRQAHLNGWGPNPTEDQIDSADVQVIKAWLDEQGAEYPPRAARTRLVDLAKMVSANEPPF